MATPDFNFVVPAQFRADFGQVLYEAHLQNNYPDLWQWLLDVGYAVADVETCAGSEIVLDNLVELEQNGRGL